MELCFNGVWGTVCAYPWTQPDAQVVCSQLQLGTGGEGHLDDACKLAVILTLHHHCIIDIFGVATQ